MFQGIPGNVWEDSRKCSRRFQGILLKILGSVRADYVESKIWFISWNLLIFYEILLWNCCKTVEKNNYCAIFLKKTFSSLRLITSLLSLITTFLTYFFFFLFLSFLCWGKGVITVRRDRGIKKTYHFFQKYSVKENFIEIRGKSFRKAIFQNTSAWILLNINDTA